MIEVSEESSLLLTLGEITQLICTCHRPQETLNHICELIAHRFHTDVCSVYVLEPESNELVLRATHGLSQQSIDRIRMKVGEGLTGLVAEQGTVNVASAQEHPNFRLFPDADEEQFKSFLGVPLRTRGSTIGVIVVQQREARQFTNNQVILLTGVASQLIDLIAQTQVTEQLAKLSRQLDSERSGAETGKATRRLSGHAAGPGFGLGRAMKFEEFDFNDPKLTSRNPGLVVDELERFERALDLARVDIDSAAQHLSDLLGEQMGAIMQAQRVMLEDSMVQEELRDAIQKGASAEQALVHTCQRYLALYQQIDNPFFQERIYDVKDVFRRVLAHLLGHGTVFEDSGPVVLIGHEVSLLELFSVDLSRVRGIAVSQGGSHSHVAILARSLNIPMLTSLANLHGLVQGGDFTFVDGHQAELIVRPSLEQLELLRQKDEEQRLAHQATECEWIDLPIRLETTVNLLPEAARTVALKADGIGLYRSEFLEMARRAFPSEEEQFEVYRSMVQTLDGKPITIRTMDLRSEKIASNRDADGVRKSWEWRLVDRLPHVREVIQTQIRAILRAAAFGPIRILFPMIASRRQLEIGLEIIANARRDLTAEEFDTNGPIPVGLMVETPAAAMQLSKWIDLVDFVGIGSNDLLHSLLGIERNDDELIGLKNPLDPAFIKTVAQIVDTAHQAQKTVVLCGDAASNPSACVALYLLGVDTLSVSVDQLARVRKNMCKVIGWSEDELANSRAALLKCETITQVEQLLADAVTPAVR